jgi:hypothetical protein
MSTCVLTPSSSAQWFWDANQQTSSHFVLRSKPRNCRSDFEAQTTKQPTLSLRPKPRNRHGDFEAQITKPSPLVLRLNRETCASVSSTCTMRIAHDITWPPGRPITKYLTCAWSSLILYTKSPTPASILLIVRQVAFATYTSRDKKHVSPHRITHYGLVQPKCAEFKFKLEQVNYSSHI